MVVAVLCALAAAVAPQDTGMLDVPVYRNPAYGVALPRPFPDWVFSAGRSPRTTTVLFHPRLGSLREQLWGALVLTTFDRPIPLGAVADQRLDDTWRAELGPTFRLLTRDSLTVAGLPAIHLVMAGAVNRLAVDVEEYAIVRGRDLVVLQFRYPRGLPRDSIAAGYERTLAGFVVSGDAAPVPSVPADAAPDATRDVRANRVLASSPWRPRAIDARIRIDSGAAEIAAVVRLEVVNADTRPRDTLVIALRSPWVIDSVRSATGRALPGRSGSLVIVPLAQPVEALAATAVTLFYRLPASLPLRSGPSPARSATRRVTGWAPAVEPWTDSAGADRRGTVVRRALRFDTPLGLAVVTSGRLAVDLTTGDRRQMTWTTEREVMPSAAFIVGPFRRALVRSTPLVAIRAWLDASAETTTGATRIAEIVDAVSSAWGAYTRAFGRLVHEDAELVVGDALPTSVTGATMTLSPSAPLDSIRATVARVWWGQVVGFEGQGAAWLEDALSDWSALAARAASDGDSVRQRVVRDAEAGRRPVAALEAASRAMGEARFRSALREVFLNNRHRTMSLREFRDVLGPVGANALPAAR